MKYTWCFNKKLYGYKLHQEYGPRSLLGELCASDRYSIIELHQRSQKFKIYIIKSLSLVTISHYKVSRCHYDVSLLSNDSIL